MQIVNKGIIFQKETNLKKESQQIKITKKESSGEISIFTTKLINTTFKSTMMV